MHSRRPGVTTNQPLQRTGRASRSLSFESASGARPAAERRSVMEHGMAEKGRLKSWLRGILLATAVVGPTLFAFKYRARSKSMEIFDVPVAIYDTGNLVDFFHVYKQKNGKWPEPGM